MASSVSKKEKVSVEKTIQIVNNTAKSATVYESASTGSKKIGVVPPDFTTAVTYYQNNMYYMPLLKGWIQQKWCKVISNKANVKTLSKKKLTEKIEQLKTQEKARMKAVIQEQVEQERLKQIARHEEYINNEFGNTLDGDAAADSLIVNNLNGVYGIPYQFIPEVDPRLSSDVEFGQIYADRIISRMPLLMISPGTMDFLANYTDNEKTTITDALFGSSETESLTEFLTKPGKYYTFKYDSVSYWNYVNTMNHTCASYLGIGDVEVNINGTTGKLKSFKWEQANNGKFDQFILSNQDMIVFYCDADTTKNENFSNETTASQLASKVNDFSALAKEVQFILGSQTGGVPSWLKPDTISEINNAIAGIADTVLDGSEVFKNIAKEFSVIATGGKLAFPEIWSDSSFTQSFDVKIKLRCPCPNKLQWFLDICVPINMLLALTLPRTPIGKTMGIEFTGEEASFNGYMSPFLVRAFYKGLFNCDMGIITGLSISKGKEGSWTLDGLPTEVDIDLEIKDLYNVLFMTSSDTQPQQYLNNTTFLSYIAMSCGISINKPDLERSADLALMTFGNALVNKFTGYNFWRRASQGLRNKAYNIYKGLIPG